MSQNIIIFGCSNSYTCDVDLVSLELVHVRGRLSREADRPERMILSFYKKTQFFEKTYRESPYVDSPCGGRLLHEDDGDVEVGESLGVVRVGHLVMNSSTLDGEALVLSTHTVVFVCFSKNNLET